MQELTHSQFEIRDHEFQQVTLLCVRTLEYRLLLAVSWESLPTLGLPPSIEAHAAYQDLFSFSLEVAHYHWSSASPYRLQSDVQKLQQDWNLAVNEIRCLPWHISASDRAVSRQVHLVA